VDDLPATAHQLVTLDVDGLPVIRQWFVLSRKDQVLAPPPARAIQDFQSAKGAQFLPKTHVGFV